MKKIIWTQVIALTFTISIIAGLVGGALTNDYLIAYLFGQLTDQQGEEFPIVKKVIEERVYVEESSTISAIEKASKSVVHFWDIFTPGIIITTDGMIITCEKPFVRATQVAVYMGDTEEYMADIVYRDPKRNILLMKLRTENEYEFFETLTFADEEVKLGQKVLSLGRDWVKSGIISKLPPANFDIDYEIDHTFECGPSINLNGELIGLTIEDRAVEQGTSSIIPAQVLQQILDSYQLSLQ